MPLSPQPLPLAASTSPLSSSVAVCAVHDLPGSYTRADAPKGQTSPTLPATRTLPSGSSVAVGPSGIPSVLPAAAQVPLAGSYNSAEATLVLFAQPAAAADHEHPAIAQQCGRVVGAGQDHIPGGGPRPADGVVQLGLGSPAPLGAATRHQHLSIAQQRCRVIGAGQAQFSGGGPCSAAGVVQFRRAQSAAARVQTARHEHLAIGQQRGRVVGAGGQHLSSGGPPCRPDLDWRGERCGTRSRRG